MKRTFCLLIGVGLALISCSKEEPLNENRGRAIDFRALMQSRASEITTSSLTSFWASAFDKDGDVYFGNAEFTKQGTRFTSTPPYFWPGDGSNLTFYAYSPSAADLNASVRIGPRFQMAMDYAPAAKFADQKDFITAETVGSSGDEAAGVALKFMHQLAQIEVKAKNANDAYVYKVQGVRIGQPLSKGTYDFATREWGLGSDKMNYEVVYPSARTLTADPVSVMETEGDNAMLLPQQLVAWADRDLSNRGKGAYIALKVNITTKSGARVYPAKSVGEFDWAAVAVGTDWQAGQKYVYTLDFTNGAGKVDPEKPTPVDPDDPFTPGINILGNPIQFSVEVNAWTEAPQDVAM